MRVLVPIRAVVQIFENLKSVDELSRIFVLLGLYFDCRR